MAPANHISACCQYQQAQGEGAKACRKVNRSDLRHQGEGHAQHHQRSRPPWRRAARILLGLTGHVRASLRRNHRCGPSALSADVGTGFCIYPLQEPAGLFSQRCGALHPGTPSVELADQAKAGAEKIITKNGESYVALIDADRLDYYHRLGARAHPPLLIDDAKRGLADIAAGRTAEAVEPSGQLQQRRKLAATSSTANLASWRPEAWLTCCTGSS
jgi:hypothetical protein